MADDAIGIASQPTLLARDWPPADNQQGPFLLLNRRAQSFWSIAANDQCIRADASLC